MRFTLPTALLLLARPAWSHKSSAMMRGVVYEGVPHEMTVQDVPMPVILHETDAIVRITTSSICGSDLHVYRGVSGGQPPWVMGHEAVGYITEVGSAVASLDVGDYVVVSDSIAHGHLQMAPAAFDYYGYGFSTPDGLQAEYVRVSFAELNLIPIPLSHKTTNCTIEQDYLTLSDVFATGWAGLDFAGFEAGDSVAVFGAGPVGLLAAYSALLRGSPRVYVVDYVEDRLQLAASLGAIPINFVEHDPVAQILAAEPEGVMRSIDCVGMEALNSKLELAEDIVTRQMVSVTHFGGGIGQVGVYMAQEDSPGAPRGSSIAANVTFPITEFFGKSLSIRGGAVDPKVYAPILVDLVQSGRAHPGFISTAVIGIEEAPAYYERFNCQKEIKVYIRFPERRSDDDPAVE